MPPPKRLQRPVVRLRFAIATHGDHEISEFVEHTIKIPAAPELVLPILNVVPLQLLASK